MRKEKEERGARPLGEAVKPVPVGYSGRAYSPSGEWQADSLTFLFFLHGRAWGPGGMAAGCVGPRERENGKERGGQVR